MRVYRRGSRWYSDEIVDGVRVRRALGDDIKTKSEALKRARKRPKHAVLTLKVYFDQFLRESCTRLSLETQRRYDYTFKALFSFFGVFFPVFRLTSRDINRFAFSRLAAGLSPHSVNIDLRNIRAALRRAEFWGLLDKAPVVELVKTPKRLPRHLTLEQFEALLAYEVRPDFKRLWTFLFWTGTRRSEACYLSWPDVVLNDKPFCRVIGKGDKERLVPLLPPAVDALGTPGQGRVFCFFENPSTMTHYFCQLCKRAGIKARLHDLRHSCLTMLVAHGLPLKLVQDMAGHSSITTTMGYAKVYSGDSYGQLYQSLGFSETQKSG